MCMRNHLGITYFGEAIVIDIRTANITNPLSLGVCQRKKSQNMPKFGQEETIKNYTFTFNREVSCRVDLATKLNFPNQFIDSKIPLL